MEKNEQAMKNVELDSQAAHEERKPYEKPRIIFRQPIEFRAIVCEQSGGGKGQSSCTYTFS